MNEMITGGVNDDRHIKKKKHNIVEIFEDYTRNARNIPRKHYMKTKGITFFGKNSDIKIIEKYEHTQKMPTILEESTETYEKIKTK